MMNYFNKQDAPEGTIKLGKRGAKPDPEHFWTGYRGTGWRSG